MKDEDLKKFQEQATVNEVIKGGNQKGKNSLIQEILARDSYKQQVLDGLLGIRREKRMMENENGQVYLQEFVRKQDKTGQWLMLKDIPEKEWEKIKQEGPVNEKGAKAVLVTLNSLGNNNIALSNLNEKQISRIGENSFRSIDNKLRSQREEYDIGSTENIEWIMDDIVVPNVSAGLRKAKDGKFLAELLSQTNIVGTLDDEEEGSGGLLGASIP